MKRVALVLMMAGMIAGVALAADTVTSVNAVGFSKITIEEGKMYLVATAFEDIDGQDLKAADVFGTQLPGGTTIFAYNPATQTYDIDQFNPLFQQWTANITFRGGMGFWIKPGAGGAGIQTYDVVLKGQVPMATATESFTDSGLTLLGYPYTSSVLWTNTPWAQGATSTSDKLHVYNPDTGSYATYQYNPLFQSWGSGNNVVLTMNQGFWYQTSSSRTNLISRPYNLD